MAHSLNVKISKSVHDLHSLIIKVIIKEVVRDKDRNINTLLHFVLKFEHFQKLVTK